MTSGTPLSIISETTGEPVAGPCAQYLCTACGRVYDEAEGRFEEDIDPGTPWQDVPESFLCPDCGLGKELFRKLEN